MQLMIITGASRGLGQAIAHELLADNRHLLTIARKPDPSLAEAARAAGCRVEQWALDVGLDTGVGARLEVWLSEQARDIYSSVTLINNAGVIGPVGPIERSKPDDVASVLRVGLEGPINLTAAFLRATERWPGQRRVLNISSGAGRNPIAGWSVYCAAKAGLDHFSRVVALDESKKPNGARIVSLAPGVIDTDMQGQIRAAPTVDFPDKQKFIDLHATSQLATPQHAASRVLSYLWRADFGKNPVADVRDA